MALTISTLKKRSRIPLLVIGALLCFGVMGVLLYDAMVVRGGFRIGTPYHYTINQSINNTVSYVDNSYFPNGPTASTAYISDLTDTVRTTFQYTYVGSNEENLQYTYDVRATVRGAYTVPGSDQDTSNVWTKEFQLVEPTTERLLGDRFSINEEVIIPFAEYRKIVEDFRLSLALPVTSELEVRFNVRTSGTIAGEELNDSRTSTISTPLNVQIYQLATKYDKTDTKELNNRPQQDGGETIRAELLGAALLAALGSFFIVMIWHHSIQRTAYQRELQKIYRYHDGIIIRTSRRVEIPASKTIVPVKNFDDILNLEEETKSPIIATNLGDTATQFMIAQNDIIYMYTLGEVPVDVIKKDQLDSIEESMEQSRQTFSEIKPVKRKTTKKKS